MRRFTQLFIELDQTKRTSEKLAAMERYFQDAPAEDAAWGLFFLSGRKIKRLVPSGVLADLILSETRLPEWMLGESYEAVGDFSETLALLLPQESAEPADVPLAQLVRDRMLALRTMLPEQQSELLRRTWHELSPEQRLVFNKLIIGNFRVGVAQTLIIKALANVAGVAPGVMAHRFAGAWEPTAEGFRSLLHGGSEGDQSSQPYPFFLGYPLDQPVESFGDVGGLGGWQAEWKYDGLRAQVIHRVSLNASGPLIWSRGDELITAGFPEIAQSARDLPAGTVLDGEIVAWENDHPLPFTLLQRRINRKKAEATLWTDVPIAFVAFDVLEENGVDIRTAPFAQRRSILERTLGRLPGDSAIHLAPSIPFLTWDELARLRESARERFVEGVMLKRKDGTYGVGRRRGDWWKWKIDPFTIDAVLIYAQGGSGRRAGVFTDYTFGLWENGGLVPIAKAYSGLTDEEFREVDRFIRRNTIDRHGPVRVVKPELVFELAFEAIQESTRHRAGLAVRFPRMSRWRTDKKPQDADALDALRALLKSVNQPDKTLPD